MPVTSKTKRYVNNSRLTTWERNMVLISLESKLEDWKKQGIENDTISQLIALINTIERKDIYLG